MEAGNLEEGKRRPAGYPSGCFDEESLLEDEANTEGKTTSRGREDETKFKLYHPNPGSS